MCAVDTLNDLLTQLWHLELDFAGFGVLLAFVVIGPIILPVQTALILRRSGQLIGLGIQHRV